MTHKILKANGEVVPRSTVRSLEDTELVCSVHAALRRTFDERIQDKFGRPAVAADFPVGDVTPSHEHYEDDEDKLNVPSPPPEEEPTPEAGDHYVHADVMLPRGNTFARGRVIGRKRDHEGNVVSRANDNPVLDTRQYNVEFEDGDVIELTANIIAQNMYAMCDADGHQLLVFEAVIDHQRSEKIL